MYEAITRLLTRAGVLTASPFAFVLVLAYAVLWLWLSPQTLEWHSVATLCTLAMTLFIQRAEHRDTQAIHAKLDELLRATQTASNELVHMDEQEPEQIEARRRDANGGL